MFELLIGFVLGAAIIFCASLLFINWKLIQLARIQQQAEKVLHDSLLHFNGRLEEDNGVFYVYNAKSGEFLAYGATAQELARYLDQRYPTGVRLDIVDVVGDALDRLENASEASQKV